LVRHAEVRPHLFALALLIVMTSFLLLVTSIVPLQHVASAYLIPVLIAAIALGMVPAMIVALGGVVASAFFFYPPIYDFRIHDPEHLLDVSMFVIVAVVTSQLAASARRTAGLAQTQERQMRALYAFSKRLSIATDAVQISSAIQDHLTAMTGRPVFYLEPLATGSLAPRRLHETVPDRVLTAMREAAKDLPRCGPVIVDATDTSWMIRAVSQQSATLGLLAIELGRAGQAERTAIQQRINAALADATAALERLDVARAISEAKLRTEAETLREALMGSVSHGLKTPLASIMGSASILVDSPVIASEPHLAALAGIVRDESERLNSDIQSLLDASRISAAGIRPQLAWTDPADIIRAAVSSRHPKTLKHRLRLHVGEDLPLVKVDAALIEQALGQIIDNALKYSPEQSTVWVECICHGTEIAISVRDQGMGLTSEECAHVFDRFYRGPRSLAKTTGSGLGLWIAHSFVTACGGTVDAQSAGRECGSHMTIRLPAHAKPCADFDASGDRDD
jgi:two-component system sensor histidine kinase KdpD